MNACFKHKNKWIISVLWKECNESFPLFVFFFLWLKKYWGSSQLKTTNRPTLIICFWSLTKTCICLIWIKWANFAVAIKFTICCCFYNYDLIHGLHFKHIQELYLWESSKYELIQESMHFKTLLSSNPAAALRSLNEGVSKWERK